MVYRNFFEFSSIIAVLFLFNCNSITRGAEENESDRETENKIQQALFIIDLLKKGYLKVKTNEARVATTTVMPMITDAFVDDGFIKIMKNYTTKETVTMASTPKISTIIEKGAANPSQYRRRYGEVNTSIISKIKSNQKNVSYTTKRKSVRTRKKIQSTNSFITSKIKNKPKKLRSFRRDYNTKDTMKTKDMIQQQVAVELANELRSEGIITRKSSIKLHKDKKVTYRTKSTLKIYLEDSTRFAVPLFENHAFCYTNPNNPLCKTVI